jgi:hypothetical protein
LEEGVSKYWIDVEERTAGCCSGLMRKLTIQLDEAGEMMAARFLKVSFELAFQAQPLSRGKLETKTTPLKTCFNLV